MGQVLTSALRTLRDGFGTLSSDRDAPRRSEIGPLGANKLRVVDHHLDQLGDFVPREIA